MMTMMMKCPGCNGEKTQTIQVVRTDHDGKTRSSFVAQCIHCKGEGEVTVEKVREMKAARESWCRCQKPGKGRWHADGNDIAGKHCVTCPTCGKLLQVG